MAYEKRDNSGVLYRNDRKATEKHPDYTGNCTIDGKDYWISGWVKEGNKGKFFSFAFKPKEKLQQSAPGASVKHTVPPEKDDSDPVPF